MAWGAAKIEAADLVGSHPKAKNDRKPFNGKQLAWSCFGRSAFNQAPLGECLDAGIAQTVSQPW
jgi:hypothetical protein